MYILFSQSDLHNGEDIDYLKYKWEEYFLLLDVNTDNVLDSADMEMEKANFARMNNLTEQEVRNNVLLHINAFITLLFFASQLFKTTLFGQGSLMRVQYPKAHIVQSDLKWCIHLC